ANNRKRKRVIRRWSSWPWESSWSARTSSGGPPSTSGTRREIVSDMDGVLQQFSARRSRLAAFFQRHPAPAGSPVPCVLEGTLPHL
ncbi:unnamed protein product, partial [Amoebophrya sp. A120]